MVGASVADELFALESESVVNKSMVGASVAEESFEKESVVNKSIVGESLPDNSFDGES